jgi:hypothetical protein
VLDRTRNADRDIDFGGDDLAGLADLIVVGDIARIDGGARRTDGGTQLVRQRENGGFKGRPVLQRATTRNDDLGAGQFGAFKLDDFGADKARRAGIARARNGFDSGTAAFAAALAKAVPRTVMTFFASDDCTVAIAFPA